MMQSRIAACCLLLLSSTCNSQGPRRPVLAELFPAVPTIASLSDVRVGMTYKELRELRSSAVPAPYVGLIEVVNRDTVQYHFNRDPESLEQSTMLRYTPSAPSSKLVAIDVWSTFDSLAQAELVWRQNAGHLARNGQADCFRYQHGQVDARAAVRSVEAETVGALLYAPRALKDAGGVIQIPAIVRTFTTSDLDLLIPAGTPRERVACSEVTPK